MICERIEIENNFLHKYIISENESYGNILVNLQTGISFFDSISIHAENLESKDVYACFEANA